MRRRSLRASEGVFVAEGEKLLSEALRAGHEVESIFVVAGAESGAADVARSHGVRVHVLEPGVIERIADTVTPQPVIAVLGAVDVSLDVLLAGQPRSLLVLVDVRDPGNAGTVLRSAEASGVGGVVMCGESVDLYNPKTVRSSAGSLFHVPITQTTDANSVVAGLASGGIRCLGAAADGAEAYDEVDFGSPTALFFGNEAAGLASDLIEHLDGTVRIPIEGRSESLNVGMAAAVLAFELARQRRHFVASS